MRSPVNGSAPRNLGLPDSVRPANSPLLWLDNLSIYLTPPPFSTFLPADCRAGTRVETQVILDRSESVSRVLVRPDPIVHRASTRGARGRVEGKVRGCAFPFAHCTFTGLGNEFWVRDRRRREVIRGRMAMEDDMIDHRLGKSENECDEAHLVSSTR